MCGLLAQFEPVGSSTKLKTLLTAKFPSQYTIRITAKTTFCIVPIVCQEGPYSEMLSFCRLAVNNNRFYAANAQSIIANHPGGGGGVPGLSRFGRISRDINFTRKQC